MCGKKKEPSLSKYLGIRKAAYKGLKLWSFYTFLYKNLVLVLQNSLQIKTEILPHLVILVTPCINSQHGTKYYNNTGSWYIFSWHVFSQHILNWYVHPKYIYPWGVGCCLIYWSLVYLLLTNLLPIYFQQVYIYPCCLIYWPLVYSLLIYFQLICLPQIYSPLWSGVNNDWAWRLIYWPSPGPNLGNNCWYIAGDTNPWFIAGNVLSNTSAAAAAFGVTWSAEFASKSQPFSKYRTRWICIFGFFTKSSVKRRGEDEVAPVKNPFSTR